MNLTFVDIEWLIATQWTQLSIAGIAIFHGLVECWREWQAHRRPRVAMYGRKWIRPLATARRAA